MPKKYFILRPQDDELVPEETLIDSTSLHSKVEAPVRRGVFYVFYLIILVVSATAIAGAFKMQILEGDYYARLAERNSFIKYNLASFRGPIYSVDGTLLAQNRPMFNLVVLTGGLPPEDQLKEQVMKLSEIIDLEPGLIVKIIEENKNNAIFTLAKDLKKEQTVGLEQGEFPGMFVITDSKRHYADGPAFSQVVGYVAGAGPEDLDDLSYLSSDRIGRLGLEMEYEDFLRGKRGTVYFKNTGGEIIIEEPAPGSRLILNIDYQMQNRLYSSLNAVLRQEGIAKGAAVVQNPKTGQVLAMVSLPTYDNNLFESYFSVDSAHRLGQILNDRNRPLFNRIISGRYSPGSTIKPLLALAGLKEGNIDPSTLIFSAGAIFVPSEVDPNVVYTFRDWKVHGWTDIYKAIADSVDVYFYALGGGWENIKGLGIDKISGYISGALADKKLGIDLPKEATGFVPSREWKKEFRGEAWYKGDTYNVSIGQGDLLTTPLWINSYIGAIANGGDIMKPIVADRIVDNEGNIVKNNELEIAGKLEFSDQNLDVVRKGMKRAVEDGTARLLSGIPVSLAAKTGTAEVARGLNSMLAVFGPYDNPEIAMTIVVEDVGDEQGLALRVARDFLGWYFNKQIKN